MLRAGRHVKLLKEKITVKTFTNRNPFFTNGGLTACAILNNDHHGVVVDQSTNNHRQEDVLESEAMKTPLKIPEIVKQIFKHLPFDTLKSCRLVSTLWNGCAFPVLLREKSSFIFLDGEEDIEQFLDSFKDIQFPQVVNKLEINLFYFHESRVVYRRLFNYIAPWISELSLIYYISSFNLDLDELEQNSTLTWSSLKKLEIVLLSGIQTLNDYRKKQAVTWFTRNVIWNSPKLENLSFFSDGEESEKIIADSISGLTELESAKNLQVQLRGKVAKWDVNKIKKGL